MLVSSEVQSKKNTLAFNRRKIRNSIVFYALISVFTILWLIPVFMVVITALKSESEFVTGGLLSLPHHIAWGNFIQAWTEGDMGLYMRNSLVISVIKVPLGIFIEALAAFALTRMRFRWEHPFFIFLFIGLMVPIQVTLVPLSLLANKFHLINSYFYLIVMYIAFGLSFGIVVLRGFFRQIPREIDEAAKIDGCSDFRIFWNIILPLSKPAIATLVILDFLATWNEFLLAQTFLTSNSRLTIPAGLLHFTTQYSANYTLMMAGVLLSIIPVGIVYLVFQKYFVSGMGGAVKQ
jgi:raffinose/stachyose/melibiose transport system permease protein